MPFFSNIQVLKQNVLKKDANSLNIISFQCIIDNSTLKF